MFLQPYQPHELRFAYCYRVYFRCRTHKLRSLTPLVSLDRRALNELMAPYNVRVLKSATDTTDLLALMSLQPMESISAASSKLKGRVSKWIGEALALSEPANLLSKGYFACTVGKSRRTAVDRYLASQARHHGYDRRVIPPIFVKQYHLSAQDLARVSPKHAVVVADFHIVLATRYRKCVFGSQQGRDVATSWCDLQRTIPICIRKVSILPDHAHIALRAHPSMAPANVVVELMNSAQGVMQNELIRVGIDRLWEPSAYIGSYGDLSSSQIRKYIEGWERNRD